MCEVTNYFLRLNIFPDLTCFQEAPQCTKNLDGMLWWCWARIMNLSLFPFRRNHAHIFFRFHAITQIRKGFSRYHAHQNDFSRITHASLQRMASAPGDLFVKNLMHPKNKVLHPKFSYPWEFSIFLQPFHEKWKLLNNKHEMQVSWACLR